MVLWYQLLTQGEFGFAAQLIPLVLTIGISFFLSRKTRDMMIIAFPISIAMKLIFPFYSIAFVLLSAAVLAAYLMSPDKEMVAEMKGKKG